MKNPPCDQLAHVLEWLECAQERHRAEEHLAVCESCRESIGIGRVLQIGNPMVRDETVAARRRAEKANGAIARSSSGLCSLASSSGILYLDAAWHGEARTTICP